MDRSIGKRVYIIRGRCERHRGLLANDPDRLRDLPRAGDESFVAGVPLEFHANMEGPHRFAVM